MKRIAIVGAGTAGTIMANRLARVLPEEWRITIVDEDDRHLYQPGLLFLPFGALREADLFKSRRACIGPRAELELQSIQVIEPEHNRIRFASGEDLHYDLLIIASGARVAPEATEGLVGPGWRENVFDFYTVEGAAALGRTLARWKGGRLVLDIAEMPIKCPVAPLELLFLADAFFTDKGLRDRVDLVLATPLDGAFTKPRASAMLGHLLTEKKISVEPSFVVASVDEERRVLRSYDDRDLEYDLLVTVPLHQGSPVISRSGLGDALGFVPTDKHSLMAKGRSNIFVLGDATDLPASKAGSVAHFQSEVVEQNVLDWVNGRAPSESFDGHSNCFIETGHDKGMLIDFNYETEPLPGRFPLPGVGPFTLLEESHVNHWGKLAFKWVYWNLLLPGKELPLDHRMLTAGKWS